MKTLPENAVAGLNSDDQGLFASVSGVDNTIVTIDLKDGFSFKAPRDGDKTKYYIGDKLYFDDKGALLRHVESKPATVRSSSAKAGSLSTKVAY